MIRSSACQPWQPDLPGHAGDRGGSRQLHHATGHDLSSATFYAWKAKYGGMEVSEARRLKALEDENTRLKRLLADAMLDNVALKDLLAKKW
jgi:putative transposase